MNTRKIENTIGISEKRMLSEKEAGTYLGIGRAKTREFCKKINAVTHIGTRVLYDRTVIDAYLDGNRAGYSHE